MTRRTIALVGETTCNSKHEALNTAWHELVTSGNERRYVDILPWSKLDGHDRYLVRVWEWEV